MTVEELIRILQAANPKGLVWVWDETNGKTGDIVSITPFKGDRYHLNINAIFLKESEVKP